MLRKLNDASVCQIITLNFGNLLRLKKLFIKFGCVQTAFYISKLLTF